MKLISLFVIMVFVPEMAITQDTAHEEPGAGRRATDHAVHVSMNVPSSESLVELNALFARPGFASASDNRSEMKNPLHAETGIIAAWRERIYQTLGAYSDLRRPDPAQDGKRESNTDLVIEAHEIRAVELAVLKETLKFAQERIPEIDRLVRALSFEVSNEPAGKNSRPAADDKKTSMAPSASAHDSTDSRLFMKTGLRVPVEHGRMGLESRTEIKYGDISSFLNVNLTGRYDNTVGLSYALASKARLEIERQVNHTADPGTGVGATTSLNLIHLVYKF